MPVFVWKSRQVFYAAQHAGAAGLPLLLLHGAGGTYLHWPPHLRRLAGRPVFALDLPGHGRSPGPGLDAIPDFVALVAAWLAALRIDRFALGGHSLGSAIALEYTLAYPLQVAALLLAGSGPHLRVAPTLLDLLRSDFDAATARITRLSYGPAVPPDRLAAHTIALRAVDPRVLHAAFVACNDFDATGRLGEITAPTLILAGAHDRMTPPALAAELHAGIVGSTLHTLDCGHMIPIEQPDVVTALAAEMRKEKR